MTTAAGLEQITEQYRGPVAQIRAAVGLSAEAALGRLVELEEAKQRRRAELWQHIHTIPIRAGALTNQVAQNGVLDYPDRYGPHEGYMWDVHRLSAWGWTAGSVAVYLNDSLGFGEQLANYSVPGQWTWGHRQMVLTPRDRVVVVATNITGAVYFAGQATEVEAPWWAEYIL